MARGSRGNGNPYGPLFMLLAALSIGCCIAILVLVNQQLWYRSYVRSGWSWYALYDRCFMQTESSQSDINLCYFTWAGSGLGLFFALWLFFMQLCSGRNRHIPVCEVAVCLVATVWWIACATTATVLGKQADDFVPLIGGGVDSQEYQDWLVMDSKQGQRTAVWALGWANMGLFAIASLLALKDCCTHRKNPPQPAQPSYLQGAYVQSQPAYQPQYQQQPYAAAYGAPPSAYPPTQGYPPQQQQAPSPYAAPAGYPPVGTSSAV